MRRVAVEDADGRVALEEVRCVVVPSSQLAHQQAQTYIAAQAQEAAAVTPHVAQVEARPLACAADAAAAITEYEGHRQGRRGRRPQPWRYHALCYTVEPFSRPKKRARWGRPAKTEPTPEEPCYRVKVAVKALERAQDEPGWFILATTVGAQGCTDTQLGQAYQEQNTTVEPGVRWIKNPAAIAPVWLEKPERMAALAMLTVRGLLVYTLLQRQVRLYLQQYDQQLPGNKGATAIPTAAVVLSLFAQVMMVHLDVERTVCWQVCGVQDHHVTVCDALGLDRSWYTSPPIWQNCPLRVTPP
jgi:hypothetical protein